MSTQLEQKTNPVKKFYNDHKSAIIVTALTVTTTAAVLMRVGIAQHNDFLKEHDLYEKFYETEED